MQPQFHGGRAAGPTPWGFLEPPHDGRPGVAVFAQTPLTARVVPSGGPAGAWSAAGSREVAEGAAHVLAQRAWPVSFRASLHCPAPRRLFAARGARLLGAIAAARAGGEQPSRAEVQSWSRDMGLGFSVADGPGNLLGAWLLSIAPHPDLQWRIPPEPRLDVGVRSTCQALLDTLPELAAIWHTAEGAGAIGTAYDPAFGLLAIIFPGGNAPHAVDGVDVLARSRVGLSYHWI